MADEIVEEIRRRVAGRPVREPHLTSGERVRITQGSFSGIETIFLANDGEQRALLLLNILQSEQRLTFPIESVERLRDQEGALEQ